MTHQLGNRLKKTARNPAPSSCKISDRSFCKRIKVALKDCVMKSHISVINHKSNPRMHQQVKQPILTDRLFKKEQYSGPDPAHPAAGHTAGGVSTCERKHVPATIRASAPCGFLIRLLRDKASTDDDYNETHRPPSEIQTG